MLTNHPGKFNKLRTPLPWLIAHKLRGLMDLTWSPGWSPGAMLIGQVPYIVIYQVRPDEVQILRVLTGGQDVDSRLEEGFPQDEN
jgi:plasmid stabilization system protein ParE